MQYGDVLAAEAPLHRARKSHFSSHDVGSTAEILPRLLQMSMLAGYGKGFASTFL